MATRATRKQPRQRHLAVFEHVRVVHVEIRWHVLDGELNTSQFVCEPLLQRLDRVQNKVIEHLRAGSRQRHRRRYQPAAQPSAMPVASAPARATVATIGTGHAASVALPRCL
jgi:hypothetical protein